VTETARSAFLFAVAALAEIGGVYLVWIGLREGKGAIAVVSGCAALCLYGLVAALQPASEFGRVLAAYGGVFVIGALGWGMAVDGFKPGLFDLVGVLTCLVGVGLIMYVPR
jgi:small multidrug resistance family-3 protein